MTHNRIFMLALIAFPIVLAGCPEDDNAKLRPAPAADTTPHASASASTVPATPASATAAPATASATTTAIAPAANDGGATDAGSDAGKAAAPKK